MKKGVSKYLQYVVVAVVVVILLCGIFSIVKRLTGTSSTGALSKGENGKKSEKVSEKTADNSVPMTRLTVTAPTAHMRVGEEMKLSIETEPKGATNTELKWSCSEKGAVKISKNGVLVPAAGGAKKTVKITAKATDGSGLSSSFDLRIYPEIDPSKPMVAITMDDGPNPDTTELMLDVLEENYAKATFFCLGQNVGYYPDTVKREYDLGMEVGTHTQSHKQLSALSSSALTEEIETAIEVTKEATGVAPLLMRPPYGAFNATVLEAAKSHGLCAVNWSLDTEDWKTKNADATYRMVMTATDGDVVLLHDIHEYNVDAVRRFVPDLIAEGFQLVTVSEMYEARGETLEPGTIHYRTDPTTEASEETTGAAEEDGAKAPTVAWGNQTTSAGEDSSSTEDDSDDFSQD
ncbi:MAG: polysaccharide deacetylase family protein [Eubacteriales bacterium]|nr:polysaccharide deacetylase family protein [Eubacteriales bacterium]